MATRPRRKQSAGRSGTETTATASASVRDRVIDALMALLAERDFMRISLSDIAAEADLSLAEMRAEFGGKLAILAAFSKRIDEAVLAQGPAEGEGAKDRLFDILMRRLDALSPYKLALKCLAKTARRSPGLTAAIHMIAGRSQQWMHAAAGVGGGGLPGAIAVEGGLLIFADTLRVWLDDDDPDLARTMKKLDESLGRGDRAMRLVHDICGVFCRFRDAGRGEAPESRAAG
jgi:AcrR family transcriptional regulator